MTKDSAAQHVKLPTAFAKISDLKTLQEIIQERNLTVGCRAIGVVTSTLTGRDCERISDVAGTVTFIHPDGNYITIHNGLYQSSFHPTAVYALL